MSNVIRVALPTRDALTDTDPSHFSLFSDSDNVLIKEFDRGADTISGGSGTATIPHNLGYIPFYIVFGEVASGKFELVSDYTLHHLWKTYATTSNLIISTNNGSFENYRYYIFYDNFT